MKNKKVAIVFIIGACVQPLIWYMVYVLLYHFAEKNDSEVGLAIVCGTSAAISLAVCLFAAGEIYDAD